MSTTFFDVIRDRLSSNAAHWRPDRMLGLVKLAWQVRRERNALAQLTPRQLEDVGLNPGLSQREAKRDLFDLPKGRVDRI